MTGSGVRLADLLASMSLLTDLGFGQPPTHMLRAARIGMRIGERLGLGTPDLATLYDVNVLTYVGCAVYGNEAAAVFGDDIDFRSEALRVDLAGPGSRRFMLGRLHGASTLDRAQNVAGFVMTGGRTVVTQMANHCSAAGQFAQQLGLSDGVRAGVEQSYARWDGRGVPDDLAGDSLSLAARIAHVAETCELFHRTAGVAAAVAAVHSRRGTHFDPMVVDAVAHDPEPLFAGLDDDLVDEILAAEPIERPELSEDELDRALAAIGDFCDLRCPYFAGHARGTAALATAAAELMQLPAGDVSLVRRAALVHDVGRFGVPATILDKPGPLTAGERERMRMHAYYVERVFDHAPALRRIGSLAATHHERMDGSGYHRSIAGPMLTSGARVLAAADAYHAMTQPRAHRPALPPDDAARTIRTEADAGRFDHVAVDAVLTAAGQRTSTRSRAGGPSGLTAREVDVLALLARGDANKAIAKRLGITPKTVGNHVEHIYAKLSVSNRAGAAMHAMRLGLVDLPTA